MIRHVFAASLVLLAQSPLALAETRYDGLWAGVLRTETGVACDSSYAVKVEIRDGSISGQMSSPIYKGTLSGAIAEDGTLKRLEGKGATTFRLQGRALGRELTGTWTADTGTKGTCRGGFVLFQETSPRRLQPGQATAPAKQAAPEPPPPAAQAEKPAGRAEPFPSGFYIQLASLKSRDRAEAAWAELRQDLPDLLGDMPLSLQSADLGDRGIYYRVRVGPFPNLATAEDLCWQIKAEKRDCVVVRRR